jgi:hypothetical protein
VYLIKLKIKDAKGNFENPSEVLLLIISIQP